MKRVVIFMSIVLFFTTILQAQVKYDFVVAKDGSGCGGKDLFRFRIHSEYIEKQSLKNQNKPDYF